MSFDLMSAAFSDSMTDEQLKGAIQKLMPLCLQYGSGFCATISGFDDDPRELYEIPEVEVFCRRLVDIGVISCLEVSTTSPEIMSDRVKNASVAGVPGLGALEIWMMSKGLIKGKTDILQSTMNEFIEDLMSATERARIICDELAVPKDGQHKTNWSSWQTNVVIGPSFTRSEPCGD